MKNKKINPVRDKKPKISVISNGIKKANLPFDKMSEKEKDYVAIILEEVRSNFAVFGETLGGFGDKLELVRQKGDATFEEVGRIKGEIIVIKEDIVEIKGEMKEMNNRLDRIESEVLSIRSEIEMLKMILTKKVDIDYVEKLEIRLRTVENHLKLSVV
ncbi:MAG: hypothetical protein KAV41_00845 [Candidatus Pacebacteria bacterium]|nr:hypothetical protein [Candidatus Paceibacterota bacterium]